MRVLIADDEELAREHLTRLLGREQDVTVVASCRNGGEAVEAAHEAEPDVLFLDVEMPVLDGFAVVESIQLDPMPLLVFVTAHDRYAIRAFEERAIDYLLKPIRQTRVHETIERLRTLVPATNASIRGRVMDAAKELNRIEPLTRLLLDHEGRMVLVPVAQVDAIEAEGNYVRIHAGAVSYLHRRTLAALEERLPSRHFSRISRSAIVNLSRVQEIIKLSHGDMLVRLQTGQELKLSRTYRESFEKMTGR